MVKAIVKKLMQQVEKKEIEEIKETLESKTLTSHQKGLVFELFLEKLFKGNGWLAKRMGGKDDLGADLLLSHPNAPNKVSLIIQAKNHAEPLSFDETKIELVKFEDEASKKYDCKQYALISLNGFVKKAKKLEQFNLKLETFDYVERLIQNYSENHKEPVIDLYAHNKIAYESLTQVWKKEKRTAIVQATGTGKSMIIAKTLAKFQEKNKIVLAPNKIILKQVKEKAFWACDNTIFMTYAKTMNLNDEQIKSLHLDVIVLDEFHRCGAEKWGKGVTRILEAYPDAYVLGTSATPIRYTDNARDMSDELFDKHVAHELTLSQAIVKGILPTPKYITSLYSIDEEIENMRDKIENSENSEEEKEEFLKQLKSIKLSWENAHGVSQIIKKHITNENKMIVFCEDNEHLRDMRGQVFTWFAKAKLNIKDYTVVSGDPDAKQELEDFIAAKNKNKIHLLFCIDMLNEGIHVKDVDGVILLRKTSSPNIYYQQIGRALETGKQKEPLILDLVNNFNHLCALSFQNSINEAKEKEDKLRSGLGLKSLPFQFEVVDETKDSVELFDQIEESLLNKWEYWYDKLKEFYSKEGHCFVPDEYDVRLANWVRRQRSTRRKEKLDKQQIDLLNEINFVWDKHASYWEQMYAELKEYHVKNGHCRVFDKDEEHPELANWVTVQRRYFKNNLLSKEKIQKLKELGFIWDVKDESWFAHYEIVKQLFEKQGNCLVEGKGKEATHWIISQRTAFRKRKLSKEKIDSLNKINFIWDENEYVWGQNFQKLIKYKKENGNTMVPAHYIADLTFGNWVSKLRSAYNQRKLPEEKVERLNSIDFIWNIDEKAWNEKYLKLEKYKEKNGDCLVPRSYKDSELAKWVASQRNQYNKGKLTQEKIKQLNKLEFDWNPYQTQWNFNYEKLKNYKSKNKHCLVKKKEDAELHEWISTQRKAYKKEKLSEEKIEKLNELGFTWEAKKVEEITG